MKKQLLTVFAAVSVLSASAQVASPSWSVLQNANFTMSIAGHHFIDAVDANVCWVAGYDGTNTSLNYDLVSRTTNGGGSWQVHNVFPDTNVWTISNLEAIDANTAWVCAWNHTTGGDGSLWKTTNGGSTWSNVTATGMYTNSTSFANWVTWLTPSVGIANGDPVNGDFELWRTTNGGATWTIVPGANIPNPLTNEYAIVDLYSSMGPSNVWFGTNAGRVFRSNDAGVTWSVSSVMSVPNTTVTEVRFASPNNGLAVMVRGTSPNFTTSLHNTFDGGATWSMLAGPGGTNNLPANFGANEICAIPGTTYYASAGNTNTVLAYSKDNGATWISWGSVDIGYTTIDFADQWTGWAGGFSNVPDATWPGVFKYEGKTFNSIFSAVPAICLTGTSVAVTPTNNSGSNSAPVTFSWSSNPPAQFSSNTASVPVITFTAPGNYTITLGVTDPNGTGTSTQVVAVANCVAPTASFSAPANPGCQNIAMTFTNTSTGGPAPSVTVTANPGTNVTIVQSGNYFNMTFPNPGTYSVTMFASSISGTSTVTQTIDVNDCRPALTFTIESIACGKKAGKNYGDTVVTDNQSAGPINTHTWSISPATGYAMFATVGSGTLTNKMIRFNPRTTTQIYTITLMATNGSGTATTSQTIAVTPDNCVGLEEQTLDGGLSLYPNPAHDVVNVKLGNSALSAHVRLVNILGAVIWEAPYKPTGNEGMPINVSNLQKGAYFITVESGDERASRKVILN